MLSLVVRLLRGVVSIFTAAGSPRHIALGIALGAMIGLVPKGNLTAALLVILLFSLRVNLAAGTAAALLFSWAGAWTDPLANRIGTAILTHPVAKPIGACLFDLPAVPWTALNNTVVLGSLILGLIVFYPVYWLSYSVLEKHRDRVAAKLAKFKAAAILKRAQPATQWRLP
jgi:uncharacterized protein (TIGR03546 family)